MLIATSCKYCGEVFFCSGSSKRKYCCREHYVAARYHAEPACAEHPVPKEARAAPAAHPALPVFCVKRLKHTKPIVVEADKLDHKSLANDLSLNRVFLVCGFPNFKGKYDHFAGQIPQMPGINLADEDAFAFCNRAKSQISILQWQGNGFSLYFKRSECGGFLWSSAASSQVIEITPDDLKMLLEYPKLMLRLTGASV